MAKTRAWFKPLRGSYIASSYQGALTYIPFVSYLILSAWVPIHYLHPRSVAVFIAIPNWVIATIVMTAFARSRTS